jgi:hypothetical protein
LIVGCNVQPVRNVFVVKGFTSSKTWLIDGCGAVRNVHIMVIALLLEPLSLLSTTSSQTLQLGILSALSSQRATNNRPKRFNDDVAQITSIPATHLCHVKLHIAKGHIIAQTRPILRISTLGRLFQEISDRVNWQTEQKHTISVSRSIRVHSYQWHCTHSFCTHYLEQSNRHYAQIIPTVQSWVQKEARCK